MEGLQTANAPSSKIVIPHFLAGAIAFLVAAMLLAFSNPELLSTYYDNKIVAITHIMVLGWASMLAFGALYQLIPVVYGTSLYSEKLARITFILFTISIILLAYSFWIGSYADLLFYTSLLMFFSLLLFIINLQLTYRKTKKSNIQSKFINTGIYWLAATEILGTTIALNFKYNFLSEIHLHYLKIHAHLGLVGWFLLLIMGASSILIPMFMISHNLNAKKLHYAYYFINAALVAISLDWLFVQTALGSYFYWAIFAAGIGFFLSYVYEAYTTRLRKKLDVGLKYTLLAMAIILLPLFLAVLLLLNSKPSLTVLRLSSFYGFSMIFGVISMIILGQTYKTLPFIVWLERYQPYVGKFKTPVPRALYSDKIAKYQFYSYLLAVTLMAFGIVFNQSFVLLAGSILLILAAILNLVNVLLIISHKTKLEELTATKS